MISAKVVGEELSHNTGNYSNKIMYTDRSRTCHGEVAGMTFADWRKKANSRPLVVTNKKVDTTACL